MGHPILRQVAKEVEQVDSLQIKQLLTDMFDTMQALNGVGIAAPQIGVPLQVVMFEVADNPRYPHAKAIPFTVLINPRITPLSEERTEDFEGCLSVPGLRALIPRYRHIRYQALDPSGAIIEREVSDFHARVVQHECDHLKGILFPDRVEKPEFFGFESEMCETIIEFRSKMKG